MPWGQNAYFGALPESKLRQIQLASGKRTYARNEMIWANGREVNFVGFIQSGFVKMVKPMSTGAEVAMEIFGPGQIFGFLGTMDGNQCPLTAYAVGKVRLITIPKPLMISIYEETAEVRELVYKRTLFRFREANLLRATLLSSRAEQKVASVLLNLAEAFGTEVGPEIHIRVPLTRQDLADMVGITLETAIRVLGRFRDQELVRTEGRSLVIIQPNALRAILQALPAG